ncbi:MAG TPA: tail fiber domain-containing protein [Panacibacter sp.]|nr:tail fiber domain-containing protein [Panacibacter sp.]
MRKNLILAAGMMAISGIAAAQNTFPASGNVGIGTLSPATALQVIGGTRLGSAANYIGVDASGNLSFVGTAAYKVANNKYAFQAAANASIGLYFNATGNAIEYKSTTGTTIASVNVGGAAVGNGYFSGNLGVGITPATKKLEVASGDIRLSLPSSTTDSNTTVEFVNRTANVIDWKLEHYTNPSFDPGSLYVEYATDDFASDANLNIAAYWDSGYSTYGIKYWVLGTMYADGYYQASDSRLKKDIKDMNTGLGIISQLKPKTYFYDNKKYNALGLNDKLHYGFLAQDLEQVMPQSVLTQKALVSTTGGKRNYEEIKVVETMSLIPILTKAIQEQQAQIEALKATVDQLTQGVSAPSSDAVTGVKITSASLGQNIPNPLKGITSIRYSVPDGTASAQLLIVDNNGKTVKQMQLSKSGAGTVNIDASTLSAGTYTYSLIVDNKTVETKRMVVAN